MSSSSQISESHQDDQAAAAREAADQAIEQAKQVTGEAISSLKTLDQNRLIYLACLSVVAVATLIFNMASFSVGVDYAVSETVADAQRSLQARMNSWSYSVFASTFWGKLAWISAVGGIALVIVGVTKKMRAAWLPLAEIGCAAVCTLMLLLLLFVGFPDLSAYDDAQCSATLLGYWLPFLASIAATIASARRLVG